MVARPGVEEYWRGQGSPERWPCGVGPEVVKAHAEAAEALGVNERTVRRDWERARLWLAEALG